jgi:hypothetical protein
MGLRASPTNILSNLIYLKSNVLQDEGAPQDILSNLMYLKSSVLGDEWAPHASRCQRVKSQNKFRKIRARTHVNSRIWTQISRFHQKKLSQLSYAQFTNLLSYLLYTYIFKRFPKEASSLLNKGDNPSSISLKKYMRQFLSNMLQQYSPIS